MLDIPWWMKELKKFEQIQIPSVDNMLRIAQKEKELFLKAGLKSLIAVPLVLGGCLYGFLGFGTVRKESYWTAEMPKLMKIIGEVFINALERKRMVEELNRQIIDLKELAEMSVKRELKMLSMQKEMEGMLTELDELKK